MITITGATGALNGRTVDHLLQNVDPSELTVVVRDPARAERFATRGVAVRRGDYADPEGLPSAFEGADRLLLVSSNDQSADAVALHAAAVRAAASAGVGHVLYTSHQGAHEASPFAPARDHAATEALLADSGLPWTALRNGFYAHTLAWMLGPWRETGVVSVPADGPVSWTSREDAAEAAALLLVRDDLPTGPVVLTATDAPRFADLARWVGEAAHREVGVEAVDEDEWVQRAIAAGQPAGAARFTLGIFRAAAGGFFAGTDPALRDLLGREPVTAKGIVQSFARD
ncbi:NAD(P)H-binding protein [Microbacterium sp. Bi128]|uniref:NAD(P)H-binding protein n=1 Tax=Microbacterium sp. Bi128 TaxID=2821115 RepID=UPI001DBCCCDE|nr:NAD(P)H-binding protein [Microbacterium sp. Bi128]CAH0256563.1 Quinone oxidoreductase 2 [Microbacterium sp. Bi128]